MTSVLVFLFLSPAIKASTANSESTSLQLGSQTVVQLGRFSSIEVRNGGKVFVRHGATQRVTLLKGIKHYTQVTNTPGDHVEIHK